MSVNLIGNSGGASNIQQGGKESPSSIERRIKQLEEQLKQVKTNHKLSPDEREKRIENLENQIERLKEKAEKSVRKSLTLFRRTGFRKSRRRICRNNIPVISSGMIHSNRSRSHSRPAYMRSSGMKMETRLLILMSFGKIQFKKIKK